MHTRHMTKRVRLSAASDVLKRQDPNSETAHCFINAKDNRFLDYPGQDGFGYAVFGKVIKGSEVVDQIEAVETDRRDKPVKPVIIESVTLID